MAGVSLGSSTPSASIVATNLSADSGFPDGESVCCRALFPTGGGRQDGADIDRSQRVATGGIEPATNPTGRDGFGRRRGLPDVHRPEVAVVGLRIARAADNRQLPVIPLLSQTFERRIHPELVIQGEHIAWGVSQFG